MSFHGPKAPSPLLYETLPFATASGYLSPLRSMRSRSLVDEPPLKPTTPIPAFMCRLPFSVDDLLIEKTVSPCIFASKFPPTREGFCFPASMHQSDQPPAHSGRDKAGTPPRRGTPVKNGFGVTPAT